MPNIMPFLWFNGQAEEAAEFYTSVFPRSKIHKLLHYTETGEGRNMGSRQGRS